MGDVAIFTPAVAEGLIARGFELVARTRKAYYFEESAELWCAVDELLEDLKEENF